MRKKIALMAVAGLAIGFGAPRQAHAGTEMVEPQGAPVPRYEYAPAPAPRPVVYYAPPPVRVVVYPGYGYYGPRFRGYGYHRSYARRGHWRGHHWR